MITKLRAAEQRKADTPEGKNIIKGTKWLLLKNKANLKNYAKKELKQFLELNENLATAYILKEKLASIWKYHQTGWAKRAIDSWVATAEESVIRGIKILPKCLKNTNTGYLITANIRSRMAG